MPSRSPALFLLTLALAPALRAEAVNAKPAFPANSPDAMTDDPVAGGLPGYDDGSGDQDDATKHAPQIPTHKRGKTQTLPTQFGITLVTPIAANLEQRIPVSMNSGATGTMKAWSYGGEASYQRVTPDFYAYVNFNYKRTDFAFDGVPVAPWGDLDLYRITSHIEYNFAGNWSVFADGGVTAALERTADFDDSMTGRMAVGAKYRFSEHFAYYFGVTAITRLDRYTMILPLTAFEIRYDKWTVRSLNGVIISYDTFGDNSLVFDASILYDNTFFRRSDDPATGRGRTVEFQEVPLTFGVTKALGKYAFVRGYATAIVWNDYRFATQGTTTGDFQTSPGLLFGVSAGLRF